MHDQVPDSSVVDGTGVTIERDDALDLGGDEELSSSHIVIERSHAESVPAEPQTLRSPIPQHERPHAAQSLEARHPVVRVGGQDKGGVRREVASAAGRLQTVSELPSVVNVTIEAEGEAAVVADDRLMAGRPHRGGANPEEQACAEMTALAVGAAVSEPTERGQISRRILIDGGLTVNAEDA